MISAKSGNVSLHYTHSPKVADITNIVCVPFELSGHCMKAIHTKNNLTIHAGFEPCAGAEEAALAYAIVELVSRTLGGTPKELGKFKTSNIGCSYSGHFSINWNNASQFGAYNRDVIAVLKSLTPEKVYQGYTDNCRFVGADKSREQFNRCVAKFHAALKDISVFSVGKVKITAEKLKDVAEKVKKIEFPSGKPTPAASKVPDHKKVPKSAEAMATDDKDAKSKLRISDSTIAAPILISYIESKGAGLAAEIVDKQVVVYSSVAATKLKSLSDKNKVSDFVRLKYEKCGDELQALFSYYIISNSIASCSILTAASKLTTKTIESELNKILAKVK